MLPPPPLVAHKVCKTACVQSRTYASELQPGRLCPCLALALVTAGLCAPSTWPTSLRQPGPWVCSQVPEFSLRWQRSWWASPVCVHRPFTRQRLPCGLGEGQRVGDGSSRGLVAPCSDPRAWGFLEEVNSEA